MDRKKELFSLARSLGEIEKKYNVKIISSNGYTDAVIVDRTTGRGYEYSKGKIEACGDD